MEAFDIIKDASLAVLDEPFFSPNFDQLHFSILALLAVIEHYLSIRNGVASFALTIFQSQSVDLPRLSMWVRLHSLGATFTVTL